MNLEKCSNCSGLNFETDKEVGEIYCLDCGFVVSIEFEPSYERSIMGEGVRPKGNHGYNKKKILGSTFRKYERNQSKYGSKNEKFAKIRWNTLLKMNTWAEANNSKRFLDDVVEIVENKIVGIRDVKLLAIEILKETHSTKPHNQKLSINEIRLIIEKERIGFKLPLFSRHNCKVKGGDWSPPLDYRRKMAAIAACEVGAFLLNKMFDRVINLNILDVKKEHLGKEVRLIKTYLNDIWKIEKMLSNDELLIKIRPRRWGNVRNWRWGDEERILDDLRNNDLNFNQVLTKKILNVSMKLFRILKENEILENSNLRVIVGAVIVEFFKIKGIRISRQAGADLVQIKIGRIHTMIREHNPEISLLVQKLNSIID